MKKVVLVLLLAVLVFGIGGFVKVQKAECEVVVMDRQYGYILDSRTGLWIYNPGLYERVIIGRAPGFYWLYNDHRAHRYYRSFAPVYERHHHEQERHWRERHGRGDHDRHHDRH